MAAELNILNGFILTGSGHDVTKLEKTAHTDTPYETAEGAPVVGTTAGNLDLGDIAAGKPFALFFKAITGNFYIKLGATSGDPVLTDSHLYIQEGESYTIPLNPNATAMAGVRYIGDDASSKFYYCLVGKA